VWVIVGIVAVGLIVWWVAAAVDGGDEDQLGQGQEEITALEDNEEVDGLSQDQELAQGADQRAGEGLDRVGPTGEEGDQQAGDGADRLDRAVEGIIVVYEGSAQGQEVGGGPSGDDPPAANQQAQPDTQQMQRQRQQLKQATQELRQAQQDDQPKAFSQAATEVEEALSSLQQMGNFDELDQSILKLQKSVQQIQPTEPLAEQQTQVRQFFNDSSKILEQMSQNLQGTQTGGGPVEQNQPMEQGQPMD
jgi:hypothetical protein